MKLEKQSNPSQFKFLLQDTITQFENVLLQIDAGCTLDVPCLSVSFAYDGIDYPFPCSDSTFLTEKLGTLTAEIDTLIAGYVVYKPVAYIVFDSRMGQQTTQGRIGRRSAGIVPAHLPIFERFSVFDYDVQYDVQTQEITQHGPHYGVFT